MKRTRAQASMLALCLLAGLLPAAAMAGDEGLHSPLGLVDQFLLDEAVGVGSSWMRQHILWRYYEPTNGTFATGYGDELTDLEEHGLRMSPVLVAGKCWATHEAGDTWDPMNPDSDFPSGVPADLAGSYNATTAYSPTYYDFVHTFVTQYGDRIDRITIENEANAGNFWEDTAQEYIKLLVTARKAALDANPLVMVFDSGMGSGSWGAPIAQDRYEGGDWAWFDARDFLVEYYARDVYVTLPALNNESQLQAFFASSQVVFNYQRVTYILTHLYSTELGRMLVDGLNVKYTGDPWLFDEVITWIDETIASAPQQSPIPVKVNNEASSWCPSRSDYDDPTNTCLNVSTADWRALNSEMIEKIVEGLHLGLVQSLWFPFSNCLTCTVPNEATPRLGLYDYQGNPVETYEGYRVLADFVGGNREYTRFESLAGGDVERHVFTELATSREDVNVLWWDDGTHGFGSAPVTLAVPDGTIRIIRVSQRGDSTDVPLQPSINLTITHEPTVIYFDDGFTPIEWPLDPVVGPAPPAVVLTDPAPNPSSGWTRVRFGLPSAMGAVEVGIYDVAGREVSSLHTGALEKGTYYVVWDGRTNEGVAASNGIYLVRLTAGTVRQTKKLVLAR